MAATALLQHYVEYLTSPALIVTLAVVVLPIIYTVAKERALASTSILSQRLYGLRRAGLVGRSNLKSLDQQLAQAEGSAPRIKALFTYPVKSCRGVELAASEVEGTGLKYDRSFTFAHSVPTQESSADKELNEDDVTPEPGHHWRFITQREFPRLALIETELWLPDTRRKSAASRTDGGDTKNQLAGPSRPRSRARGDTLVGVLEQGSDKAKRHANGSDSSTKSGCLILRFPTPSLFGLMTQQAAIVLPLDPSPNHAKAKGYTSEQLSIWKDIALATNVTNELDPKALGLLRKFLGVTKPLALFRLDTSHKRPVSRCLPKDPHGECFEVGFADAFPVNLLGMASVKATDDQLPKEADVKGRLDARRFRANIYVTGISAFEEDVWKAISVGSRIGRDEEGLFECEAEYHVACRTARCKLPNVDPDTGVKDGNEPYTTLGKTRKVDEGAYPHPCLGMQMIPLFERGILRVGDSVEVLETGEHSYEKMFT
ncbi:hypothetical protein LTR78_008065 [Recurvomyces mirabilis]|uniref:MOSC domain-containing protein n=1 Tax=Recurvomyces mirabilis TaxID=574656 RepID=A0AAE0TQR9_9PEZI|nr:hypothetical protein LTR78_008065 [Recurvomyces mirabilis]KAK5150793.1 hypothetical protein LTS14_009856 [Recurvomyces mirabilis]